MLLIILVVVIVLALGGWGVQSGNYVAPGGLLGVVLVVILLLYLTGNLGHMRF